MTIEQYIQETKGVIEDSKRLELLTLYSELPIPSKKNEEWKFFDANPWFSSNWDFSTQATITKEDVTNAIENIPFDSLIVRENGICNSQLSILTNQDINLTNESSKVTEDFPYISNSFETFNLLTNKELQRITIGGKIQNHHIVIISFITGKTNFSNQTTSITIESGAKVQITELIVSKNAANSVLNSLTQITCNPHSSCEYTSIQNIENTCNSIISTDIIQLQDSQVTTHNYPLKGAFVRNNVRVHKQNIMAHTNLFGIFFPGKDEHFEIYTLVKHYSPECETTENFKGLANHNGQGVFSGMIYVAKDAQKTLAKQSNKNILLSESAKIHSKPQLEIYADDVSCNHGSTTGQIDSDALWYLQARGISKNQATILLLEGVMNENIEQISGKEIQKYIYSQLKSKIN